MLKPGHRIGNYEIEATLGDGGMAIVYRGRHIAMGTQHAIKVLLPNYAMQPRTVERFRLEARAQFRMRHPNIVQVTDYVDDPDAPAMVMDFIDGMNLRQAMQRRPGPWPLAEVLAVMTPVLEAMAHAHRQGLDGAAVVHRDLKPENVMLDLGQGRPWPGVPKVADFGIAKVLGSANIGTKTNARMGTAPYMAPEQFKNAKDVDARADVWALGMMLWELLAGRLPVEADDNLGLIKLYEGLERVPRVDEVVAGVPREVGLAVAQALEVGREGRFLDAGPLGTVLERLRSRSSASADELTPKLSDDAAAAAKVYAEQTELAAEQEAGPGQLLAAMPERNPGGDSVWDIAGRRLAYGLVGLSLVIGTWNLFGPKNAQPRPPPVAVTAPATTATAVQGIPSDTPLSPEQVAAQPIPDRNTTKYVDNGDGTVADPEHSLTWQRADSGKDLNRAQAKDYCAKLTLAGKAGWRLPTVLELQTTVDLSRPIKEKVAAVFANSAQWYWTGTPSVGGGSAWHVYFNGGYGNDDGIGSTDRVRCVR